MRRFRTTRIILLALAGVLTACASRYSTPAAEPQNTAASSKPLVSEQSHALRQPESPTRTVVHGDTLYSIAWESGHDYREIAKWNRIPPPYTIKPGQTLRVLPPEPARTATTGNVADKSDTKSANTGSKTGKKTVAPPVTSPKPAAVNAEKPGTKSDTLTKIKTKPVKSSASGKAGAVTGSWAWPADGQILRQFSDSDSGKGLDIGGARGQPVRAAASGRVVYQGSGLRGYGQLIIIKHNDEFLSAYAHNDRIHVKEGNVVKRGQKIADMGSTGTDRVKLHFEIRRQGVPSDPQKYLPKR